MKTNSRRKGKVVELEAVNLLKSLGYSAYRTAQHSGKDGGPADVKCDQLSNLHIEVKGVKEMRIGTELLEAAMAQAERDCANGQIPVVLWKEHRRGWRLTCEWHGILVTMTDIRPALELVAGGA